MKEAAKTDPLLRDVPEIDGFKVLDSCVIYDRVGGGGMGAVYRGRHVKLDIDVAVKCLLPHLADCSPEMVLRFEREARLAARVNHPNVVRVFDVDFQHGLHYLVMEYVKGETARERVERKGRGLPPGEAATLALEAAKGLAAAHAEGIVHRDIKPDNILISSKGEVKLADLGLGCVKEDAGNQEGITLSGMTMGTPTYMPPEQWDGLVKVGPPGDVWSLGATFFYLLAGGDAYDGASKTEVMRRVCTEPFPDPASRVPGLAPELRALIRKCTERDARKRYPDGQALAMELAAAVDRLGLKGKLEDRETGTGTSRCRVVSPPPPEVLARARERAGLASSPGPRDARLVTTLGTIAAPGTPRASRKVPGGVDPTATSITPRAPAVDVPRARSARRPAMIAGLVLLWAGLIGGVYVGFTRAPLEEVSAVAGPLPAARAPEPEEVASEASPPAAGSAAEEEVEMAHAPAASAPARELEGPAASPPPAPVDPAPVSAAPDSAPLASGETKPETPRSDAEPKATPEPDVVVREPPRPRDLDPPRIEVLEPEGDEPFLTREERVLVRVKLLDDSDLERLLVGGARAASSGDGTYARRVPLREGQQTISIIARDRAGNESEAVVDVVRDVTPPEISLTEPGGSVKAGAHGFRGRVADRSSCKVTAAGKEARVEPDGSWEIELELLPGRHSMEIVARDAAGNESRLRSERTVLPRPREASPPGFEPLGRNAEGYSEYRHAASGIVFVLVPGGSFLMGSSDDERRAVGQMIRSAVGDPRTAAFLRGALDNEAPQHEVSLDDFLIAKREVSQKEWKRAMEENPSRHAGDELPVDSVSWTECAEFCRKTGLRLPSEAQWEYACRAGSAAPFAFGEAIPEGAVNCKGSDAAVASARKGRGRPVRVGSLPANAFGIHEMHGNVWEWCEDVYDEAFYRKAGSSPRNPVAQGEKGQMSCRGGAWATFPWSTRSAARSGADPERGHHLRGFRPAFYPVP